MAHMIEIKDDGQAKMVSTEKAWHHYDTGHPVLMAAATEEDFKKWKELSGLSEIIEKVPAYQAVMLPDDQGAMVQSFQEVEDQYWIRRQSDARCFGIVTEQYKIFQPAECIDFLREFIAADERFQLNTAGTLKKGAVVWANFGFSDDFQVMGEDHKFNLLATTSFDGTASTRIQGRTIRTVCNNTLQAGEYGAAGVTIGHRTEVTPKVREMAKEQLTQVLLSIARYKVMGEALAQIKVSKDAAEKLLTSLIFTSKLEEIELDGGTKGKAWTKPSTRAQGLIDKLMQAYETTEKEGTEKGTAWTVLNTITRYADHEMGVRKVDGKSSEEARLESQTLGASSAFKSKAIAQLLKQVEADTKSWDKDAKALQTADAMLQAA